MIEKRHSTRCGDIHYFIDLVDPEGITLIFLPGLTADHRLFDKQVEYFRGKQNIFVWDAPAHALSRPFAFDFTLEDKATWLYEIMEKENIKHPVLVGQSMGGYVGQAFCQFYPDRLEGFISIDSAPLQRQYMTAFELYLLKHTEGMYRVFPWKTLLKEGAKGCATTPYGQQLMYDMMMTYDDHPRDYCRLVGHGYRMLADAMEKNLPYEITCPALLICGTKDRAGSTLNYNKRWTVKSGIPIAWIEGAGHNSNTDNPEEVNRLIEEFVGKLAN